MAQDHPPTKARHLMQEAKRGTRPLSAIARDARSITDPSFAAETLVAIAQNPRCDGADAGRMIDDALRLAGETNREWRKAELVDEMARRAASWDPKSKAGKEHVPKFKAGVVRLALSIEGESLSKCLPAVARACPDALAGDLLHHALSKGSNPANDGKEVLAGCSAPGLADVLDKWPDAALRARLLPYVRSGAAPGIEQALASAAVLPPAQQVEVLRAVIASRDLLTDLVTIAKRLPADAEASARLLCALAARADKLGQPDQAAEWFDAAEERLPKLADKAREAVTRNLTAGRDRLGGKAKPAGERKAAAAAEAVSAAPTNRHVLALVDTYEGRLSEVHLRAIGRAAPLCWAFGLDLGLVGFPTDDLAKLVRLASTETNIGEGRGYLEKLAGAGRIHLVPCSEDEAPDWDALGWAVATTPAPDKAKAVDFEGALTLATEAEAPRLCVLMGLGKKGLTPTILRSAPSHLELTGKGVSLETATAMGIIAERMRQLPVST